MCPSWNNNKPSRPISTLYSVLAANQRVTFTIMPRLLLTVPPTLFSYHGNLNVSVGQGTLQLCGGEPGQNQERARLEVMPEVPTGTAGVSRKRGAEPGEPPPGHEREAKKACWGILTSQGSWADRSPLHEAASQGRLLALRTLLNQGYPANIVTIDHVTPLHEACLSGHVACVRALIHAGANVNATTIDGVTPLFNSCASGSSVCVELLLQNGANPQTALAHHPSALHEACKRGSRECLESLLSRGVDPDFEVPHLGSALYISCLHKHTGCTKVLLHRGASVNRGRGEDTPLHAAVASDCEEQVSLLLDFGANVNLRDSNNLRPVELAPPGGKALQLLQAHNVSPRSLCELCRIHIRNLIGRSRLQFVQQLPLPPLLTQFLEHT